MLVFSPGQEPAGKTPYERFDSLIGRLLSVPKERAERDATAEKQSRRNKRTKRRPRRSSG